MPLPIRDGNQSLTTLSTLIVNSAHVPAHTVVSLGSQAITDIAQAVSGVELGPNSISALEHISVTISAGTSITIGNVVSVTGGLTNAELRASSVTIGGSVQVSNLPATQAVTFGNIAGSVTAVISGTPSVTFTQASVTFGTPVVTGSVSVLNLPSTQTVAGTVTAYAVGKYAVGGPVFQDKNIATDVNGQTLINATVNAQSVFSYDGESHIFAKLTPNTTVTIGSLPAISGTVTANPPSYNLNFTTVTSVTFASSGNSGRIFFTSPPQPGQTLAFTGNFGGGINNVYSLQAGVWGGGPNLINPVTVGVINANSFVSAVTFGSSDTWLFQQPATASDYQFVKQFGTAGSSVTATFSFVNIPNYGFERNTPIVGTVTIGNSVTIGSLPDISGTVTANLSGTRNLGQTGTSGGLLVYGATLAGTSSQCYPIPVSSIGQSVLVSGSVTVSNSVTISNLNSQFTDPAAGGIVRVALYQNDSEWYPIGVDNGLNVSVGNANPIPVSGTVTVGAVSTSVTVAQIQGTSVTTSNFTSTTASTTLVSANSARRGLTVFNEGAGNLHICAGATATTLAYQVRLSSGDYWECPSSQTSLTHSAQFASAGTARVVQII